MPRAYAQIDSAPPDAGAMRVNRSDALSLSFGWKAAQSQADDAAGARPDRLCPTGRWRDAHQPVRCAIYETPSSCSITNKTHLETVGRAVRGVLPPKQSLEGVAVLP